VAENNSEHVNAATHHPNMEVRNVQEMRVSHVTATLSTVPLMAAGPSGQCGGNARRVVVVDEPTEPDNAQHHRPNMVGTDAQEHQSKQNNVEQSNVQSTVDGLDTLDGEVVQRLVEVEFQQVSDIVLHHHLNTTVVHALVNEQKQRNVTFNLVLLMGNTQPGPNGQLAVLPAMVEPKQETDSVLHPNMEVKDVLCSVMQLIHVNATLILAH